MQMQANPRDNTLTLIALGTLAFMLADSTRLWGVCVFAGNDLVHEWGRWHAMCMELNPYAKFLDSSDPLEVLASTSGRLSERVSQSRPEQLAMREPAAKWNAHEIVVHLADCELVFGFRLRQTLAEDGPTLQPFDQNRWARHYAIYDTASALSLFAASRKWNLLLIDAAGETERAREVTHPERGTMTFWTIVETMAGHDINHLLQIERLAAS